MRSVHASRKKTGEYVLRIFFLPSLQKQVTIGSGLGMVRGTRRRSEKRDAYITADDC